MAKFSVSLARVKGEPQTETATLTVSADNADAARRLALEQLSDDSSEITWKPSTSTASTTAGTAHVVSIVETK